MTTPFITDLEFSCRWREKDYGQGAVEDWYFTLTLRLSDYSKKSLNYWGNKISIYNDRIVLGWCSNHITLVDGRLCLVEPNCFTKTTYTSFGDCMTLEDVAAKLRPHLIPDPDKPDVHRFNFEKTTDVDPYTIREPMYFIDLYCTCDKGACYQCGTLDCGCIDQCRGRCGTREWEW